MNRVSASGAKRRVVRWTTRIACSIVPSGVVERWAADRNFVFILAIGRSGTKFLASLLNHAEGAFIAHEPVGEDSAAFRAAFHSPEAAVHYIHNFRKKEIYLRTRGRQLRAYGEVNSLLRRHVRALREAFPRVTILHLVRDGAAVVRSMMARRTLGNEDPSTPVIYPSKGDPWYSKWPDMTRFERICWCWQNENEYLRREIDSTVRFEDILGSYEAFERGVLRPTGLCIPRGVWKEQVRRPINRTPAHSLSDAQGWSRDLRESFARICGSEMRAYGYSLPA